MLYEYFLVKTLKRRKIVTFLTVNPHRLYIFFHFVRLKPLIWADFIGDFEALGHCLRENANIDRKIQETFPKSPSFHAKILSSKDKTQLPAANRRLFEEIMPELVYFKNRRMFLILQIFAKCLPQRRAN